MKNKKLNPRQDNAIEYKWIDLPDDFDVAYVVPLADCHVGDPLFDENKLRGYLEWIEETPEALCFFNGDLCNCGLPHTVSSDWWKQNPLTPHDQTVEMASIVEEYDIGEKIIGIVGGSNHPARARKLTGHDYDLEFAERLGLEDRYALYGMLWMIRLGRMKHPKNGKVQYTIYATHGWSGGRKPGASINAAQELGGIILSDIYVVSHRHLDSVTKDNFYLPDHRRPRIIEMKRMYVTSGSFLKWGGYAQGKGLRPTGTGTPRIRLNGQEKDIHATV